MPARPKIFHILPWCAAVKSSQTALEATEAGFEVGTRTTVDVLDARLPPVWLEGGQWRYLLGTDGQGRDLLSRVIWGGRESLLSTLAACARPAPEPEPVPVTIEPAPTGKYGS